jgi:glycosyltransferase involved in cell wall biosynthesis
MRGSLASRPIPTVSIGLPVYNGERFLARALDSLLTQTFTDFELLIADNASTDATREIATDYARRDPRIRYLPAAVNAGMEANFLRVLGESSGPFFMWAACDDWWAPTFVERLVRALEHDPAAVVAMSDVERVDEDGRRLDVVRYHGATDPSRLGSGRLAIALAAGRPYHLFLYGLYRADVLRRVFTGFAPVVAGDRLFICRMALCGRFACVGEILQKKVVRRASLAERYADEGIGRLWRGSWARWRLALASGPYLWRSPGLPLRRKLWIPALVLRFAKASLGHSLVRSGVIRARGGASHHPC